MPLSRGCWDRTKRSVTVITRKGSELARQHATTVHEPARGSIEDDHLKRVIERTGSRDWTCVEIPAEYPPLGGTPAKVTIRYIDIEEDWRRLRLYWCNPARAAETMALHPTSTDRPSWKTAPNRLNEIARDIATLFFGGERDSLLPSLARVQARE